MSNMFKKTLVAVALTASASSAYAVTVATSNPSSAPAVASTEFVATRVAEPAATRFVQLPNGVLEVTPGVDYAAGDIIEVNFSGASLFAGINPTVAFSSPTSAGAAVAFQGVSSTNPNTLVFAVTGAFTGVAGNKFAINGVRFQAATVSSPITASVKATNSAGTVLKDNFGTQSAVILTTRSQYSASVTKLIDGKVNTANRSRFVGASTTENTLKFKVSNRETIAPASAGVWNNDLVVGGVNRLNVTFDGAFGSFTNANGDRQSVLSCDQLPGTGSPAVPVPASIVAPAVAADANTKLALRYEDPYIGAANFTVETTCTFNVTPVTSALPLSDFKVSLQFAAGDSSRFVASNLDAGKFSLDGAVVNIPYLPFGSGITHVVNLTNSGTVAGDIFAEAIDRTGKKYGPVKVGTAAANTQVALGGTLGDELVKAGMPANERAQVTLVVNAPASGITVYSAYNVPSAPGARIVVNSSNGK